eukprot:TRINITY_DN3405_c0_g1_i2.p1 TRINITY_DN3405_c0_g1~~TRINITY_DN3405_c0_g1_i2.p1  ORF type:complete len:697 (+),score=134.81 TRINITY_DN3405_c0_g1_i2:219-2309(+)
MHRARSPELRRGGAERGRGYVGGVCGRSDTGHPRGDSREKRVRLRSGFQSGARGGGGGSGSGVHLSRGPLPLDSEDDSRGKNESRTRSPPARLVRRNMPPLRSPSPCWSSRQRGGGGGFRGDFSGDRSPSPRQMSPVPARGGFGGRRRRAVKRRCRRGSPQDDGGEAAEGSEIDEANPEVETLRRVWVSHSDCAKIIGRQGRTMRELEFRSRTRLKVQPQDEMNAETRERYVEILGTESEYETALRLVMELTMFCRDANGIVLKDERVPEQDPRSAQEKPTILEVLPEEVGRVLGRRGEMVKKLETESCTKVEVDKVTGRLEIFGTREAQGRCLELLLPEVTMLRSEDGTLLKEIQKPSEDTQAEPLPPPLKLWVRGREAGRVIGRGGETVRMMMEKTGADIKVQKADEVRGAANDRQIIIMGREEEQQRVQELILAEVCWCKGPDGILKEPAEEQKKRVDTKEVNGEKEAVDRKEASQKAEHKNETPKKARRGKKSSADGEKQDKDGTWVCSKCGGDHRSKDCPHSAGLWGIGLRMGMQMGMQAMGMQAMAGMMRTPGPMPGMPPFQGMPPMMGAPGMMPPPWLGGNAFWRRSRNRSSSSGSYSGSSRGSSADSRGRENPANARQFGSTLASSHRRSGGSGGSGGGCHGGGTASSGGGCGGENAYLDPQVDRHQGQPQKRRRRGHQRKDDYEKQP